MNDLLKDIPANVIADVRKLFFTDHKSAKTIAEELVLEESTVLSIVMNGTYAVSKEIDKIAGGLPDMAGIQTDVTLHIGAIAQKIMAKDEEIAENYKNMRAVVENSIKILMEKSQNCNVKEVASLMKDLKQCSEIYAKLNFLPSGEYNPTTLFENLTKKYLSSLPTPNSGARKF